MKRSDSPWYAAGFTKAWWDSLDVFDRGLFLDTLTPAELEGFYKDWRVWGRDNQLVPEGIWTTWLLLAGRGFGKAVALDTPIPTPSGWTTMGEVRTGDLVFGDDGHPCRVTKAHAVLRGRVCYRVRFSDGAEIIADAEHLWLTEDKASRKAEGRSKGGAHQDRAQCVRSAFPKVRTTEEIRRTLMAGGERNHSIRAALPLEMPHAILPIDPYLLGCWLGDGSSKAAEITTADDEIMEAFAAAGEPVGKIRAAGGKSYTFSVSYGNGQSSAQRIGSFYGRLKSLGVFQNKHVPQRYLRASREQRVALLQGLMDTDGYAGASAAEFCATRKALAEGVFELVASLGMTPRLYEDRARLDGIDCGPRYRVSFRPHGEVFRLARKNAKNRAVGAQGLRTKRRYIVAVDPSPTVPVRCITVDSASHLYLIGREMIPTHNTRTGGEYIRDEAESGRVGRFALVGQGEDDIREVMIEGESGLLNIASRGMRPVFRPSVGAGRLVWPNGATAYLYSAADPESLRGPQFEVAWFDEPMAVPAENRQKTVANLKYGLRLGKRPRLVYSTTPKPHRWLREEMAKIQKAAVDKATGGILPNHLRRYVLTKGSTKDNAENLPESFLEGILDDYDGTNLGRQEIYAEILGEEEGALWTPEMLDANRIDAPLGGPERLEFLQAFCRTCDRIVVGIDPNTKAASKTAHEAGVIVAAKRGADRFIIEDRSTGGGPAKWARAAIRAQEDFGANEVVAEVNQGGDMVRMVIQQEANEQGVDVAVRMVRATKGKQRRAEPVAAAYERNMVKHLGSVGSTDRPGPFFKLETQMCSLHDAHDPTGEDFDRCDAAVWALTRLGVKKASGSTSGAGAGILTFEDFVRG